MCQTRLRVIALAYEQNGRRLSTRLSPVMDCESSTYRYKDRSDVPFPLFPSVNQNLAVVFVSLAGVPVWCGVLRVCPYPRHQTIGKQMQARCAPKPQGPSCRIVPRERVGEVIS